MKKTVILIAAAIALLTGCATEQPPPADSPEPPAHSGRCVSEYGSMTFNGDGESVTIDFLPKPQDCRQVLPRVNMYSLFSRVCTAMTRRTALNL